MNIDNVISKSMGVEGGHDNLHIFIRSEARLVVESEGPGQMMTGGPELRK